MTLVNDIVAKWNKDNPNIQVKATKFDGAAQDMIKKLATDVKAGAAPDLAQVGYAELLRSQSGPVAGRHRRGREVQGPLR